MIRKDILENYVVENIISELNKTETAINNIMSAIEQGVVANATAKRLKELELKTEDLEKKILIEKSKNAIKLTEEDMREFFKQSLSLEPQMLISYLIKEIRLFDNKMEIQFNSPLKQSPDDNRDFLFYSETVKMPYIIQNKLKPLLKDFILIMKI